MITGEFLEHDDSAVKLGHVVDMKKVGKVIADYDIDLIPFKIYGSMVLTVEKAERTLFDRQKLVRCYHFLADDSRLALPLNACRAVVLGEIIRVWYEVSGIEVPAKVTQTQEARMAKAKATTAEAETEAAATGAVATKEPRITNRSIIEAGLLAGKDNATIMAEVKEHFPNGKADDKHIGYYRHYLVKEGKLEKPVKAPRAKKEKAAPEAEATPAVVSAKAGSAKAAPAAPAKAAPAAPAAAAPKGKAAKAK